MSAAQVLPCPFCGDSDPAIDEVDMGVHVVVCNDCGCTGPIERFIDGTVQSAEKAIELWNKRPHVEHRAETWQERMARGAT